MITLPEGWRRRRRITLFKHFWTFSSQQPDQGLLSKRSSNTTKPTVHCIARVTPYWKDIDCQGFETWLHMFPVDRLDRTHGGPSAYRRGPWTLRSSSATPTHYLRALVLKVKYPDAILLWNYRSPNSTLEKLRESIELVKETIDEAMEDDVKLKNLLG